MPCTRCGKKNTAEFPRETASCVQYGKKVRALATNLRTCHLEPYERFAEILNDLFGSTLATGIIVGIMKAVVD